LIAAQKIEQNVILYFAGISTYLTLTEQFFSAVGSLTEVKRQFINSFVSGTGGEDFLLRAQASRILVIKQKYHCH
jgi:hypothetical protein